MGLPLRYKYNRDFTVNELGAAEVASTPLPPILSTGKKQREIAISSESWTSGFAGLSMPSRTVHLNSGMGIAVQPAAGSMDYIRTNAVPREKVDQIAKSYYWVEEDDLLDRLIQVKIDFTCMGFSLRCTTPDWIAFRESLSSGKLEQGDSSSEGDSSEKRLELSEEQRAKLIAIAELQGRVTNVSKKWDFDGLVENLIRDWFVSDSMILYWKVRKPTEKDADTSLPTPLVSERESFLPGVVNICALKPADVDWDNSLGIDRLRIKIAKALFDRIREALIKKGKQKTDALATLRAEGVEEKWIKAVEAGQDYVDLSNEDGEYWIVKSKARRQHGLAWPTMKTIFLPLESRKMLKEGDFAASFMMKHFIQLIKSGESITQGPHAGSKKNYATKAETDALLTQFTGVSKAARLSVNHTVTVEFIYPPEEMFSNKKYAIAETMIFNWSGVTITIMTGGGDGQKAGTSYIGIRRLVANLSRARTAASWVLGQFFDHVTIKDRLQTPEGTEVNSFFDENVLKEPRLLLDEIKFLVQEGIEDAMTAARELGRDPDSLRSGKVQTIIENQDTGIWEPVYKPFGNLQQEQNGGRPPGEGVEPDEDTRAQTTPRD